jgi:hypothetical protein
LIKRAASYGATQASSIGACEFAIFLTHQRPVHDRHNFCGLIGKLPEHRDDRRRNARRLLSYTLLEKMYIIYIAWPLSAAMKAKNKYVLVQHA